ncbi:sensor domain-containing diguanylate cyclase [Rhodanobacter sp. 7MK24]|uniref:sensor domain-containing diguanylate cyclase n=1 Tax=Rhodanobacter sp. 7MK24 TaxID=2775922 RepID=UPI0031B9F9AF
MSISISETGVAPDSIDKIAESLAHAGTLEELVRPLLELLEKVTGLESTYLTSIDIEAGLQHVLYARNTRRLQIAEGLVVPWGDTLCRRALDERQPYADDVGTRWGDSGAARELGIATYVSTPVHTDDGKLYGTLCAASDERKPQVAGASQVLEMFSRLIAQQIDRERTIRSLRQANDALAVTAHTDATTRLPNRRALLDEMRRRLLVVPDNEVLLVAFIDLDGFKAINDNHGHDAGDRFLIAIGKRLHAALRDGDFVARVGGDEFVVLSAARRDVAAEVSDAVGVRLREATSGHYVLDDGLEFDYGGPSIGVVTAERHESDIDAVLARADVAMYAVKRQRKGRPGR